MDDQSVLDPVLASDSWQTLMTFIHEHAPQRPQGAAAPGLDSDAMDEDIPQEVYNQIVADNAVSGGGAGGINRVCPHCTFENTGGGSDCDVCGLPL